MNLFQYHSNPEKLIGHEHQHLLIGNGAFDYLKTHSKNDVDYNLALKIVSNDSRLSYRYALEILKAPFPLGEDAIAKSDNWSIKYAIHVLLPAYERGDIKSPRFIKGEPAIAKNAELAKDYAEYIIKGVFPLAEPTIAKNPDFAYYYVLYVLKKPWKLGEPAILSSPYYREKYFELLQKWGVSLPSSD